MSRRELTALAELLAPHALLLLAAGIAVALVCVGLVFLAVRALVRLERPARPVMALLVQRARELAASSPVVQRASVLVPTGVLALHLFLGLVLTMLAVGFAVIAEEVVGQGEVVVFDRAFARALQDQVTPEWRRVFAAVSWLGTAPVLAVAAGLVAIRLFYERRPMLASIWLAGQAGGGLLNLGLKELFARTRPESADPLVATGWSFPSGHAMGTFIFCGLGAYLLLRRLRSWTATLLVVAVALAWCVIMSFSRLYLGVHYVTDVIAGLIAGAGWVVACISGVELVLKREVRTGGRAASGERLQAP